MNLQIELWQLVTLLLGFFAACAGTAKLLFAQFQAALDKQFEAQGKRLDGIEKTTREEAGQWQRIERELLNMKADLPIHYVRRDDYVQAVATIMTKLDAMALRFENILLKGDGRER